MFDLLTPELEYFPKCRTRELAGLGILPLSKLAAGRAIPLSGGAEQSATGAVKYQRYDIWYFSGEIREHA